MRSMPRDGSAGSGTLARFPTNVVHMRIISFNANGLRSAATKGFFDWFADQHADVLCVQETKAQEHQLAGPEFLPAGLQGVVP